MAVPIFLMLLCVLGSFAKLTQGYDVPRPKITPSEPRGVEISIPDEEGIQFVSFRGNINKKIQSSEVGEISKDAYKKDGSSWIIKIPSLALKNGDTINYYFVIVRNGTGYRLDGTHVVKRGKSDKPKRDRPRRHQINRRDVFVGSDNNAGSTEDVKKFKPRFGPDHCFHHSHFHPHNPGSSDSDLEHFHAHPYPHPHPHFPESGYIPETPFSSGPSFFHPEHHNHFKRPKYPHNNNGQDFKSNYPMSSRDDDAEDSGSKNDQNVTSKVDDDNDTVDTENKQFNTSTRPEDEVSSSKSPDIDVRFKNDKNN